MDPNKLLIINAEQTRQQMTSLLERMEADQGLRQLFLTDPAGVIREFILPEAEVPAAEINRGNRLLYSLLSNEGFMAWVREYEQGLVAQATEAMRIDDPAEALRAYLAATDRGRLHSDLAGAVAEFADKEIIASLMWQPERAAALDYHSGIAVVIETFVAVIAAITVFGITVTLTVGPVPPVPPLELAEVLVNRADLQAVANQVGAALAARAAEVRQSGALTDFARRNGDYT